MSEATSRPSASRGRGSGRGGRGGFAGRGGRRANGADHGSDDTPAAFDNDGDLSDLRKLYGNKTAVICEMFPDWSEADILFALQETNGDETEAATKIADGSISQWGEVSKPKKKAKEAPAAASTEASTTRATRGGRTVSEGGRGGRGRATERGGRAATRGRPAQPASNGPRKDAELSVPTEESPVWGAASKSKAAPAAEPIVEKITPETVKPTAPAAPASKTWASMLRQSAPPKPAVPKPAAKPVEPAAPAPAEQPAAEEKTPVPNVAAPVAIIDEPALPPPKDDLTETNLEQVADDSQPPATGTAASTAADSWDPRQSPLSSNATPLSAAQQQHQGRAPISGYAASAIKATERNAARVPSYQRRVLDQEEAVRMPGNRELDRAAVKFGAFNLNDGDDDVDGDREDAETRAQPPTDSPVSHPRASLPLVSQSVAVPDAFAQKANTTAPPPGMAPASQTAQTAAQNQQQYGRFGAQDAAAQKAMDPFAQQAAPASQHPFASPATSQPPQGAYSSAPGDYSNYYTANQPDRTPYNSYYGQHYGQHPQHGQQDAAASQRPLGGYNAAQADNLSQYPQSGNMHSQTRFGAASDSQNSGHSTPNPTAQAQQQSQQALSQASQPQGHGQQYPGGYNGHYYPYYQGYYQGYGQGGFPYGKGGMYGQPYGVSPNGPYDHASTQGGFSGPSTLHRDNSASGLGDYSRGASGQAASQPGLAGTGFGGASHDYQRGGGSFQSQAQSYGAQSQQANSSADDLKPFGDNKPGAGPSPSLGGARPGSAANNAAAGQGSGLPPPQSGAYSGYPQGHGSAYGAAGSQHGNGPYGSYGQGFGGSGYYGAAGGQQQQQPQQQQQQQQQQQRGWGGNYH